MPLGVCGSLTCAWCAQERRWAPGTWCPAPSLLLVTPLTLGLGRGLRRDWAQIPHPPGVLAKAEEVSPLWPVGSWARFARVVTVSHSAAGAAACPEAYVTPGFGGSRGARPGLALSWTLAPGPSLSSQAVVSLLGWSWVSPHWLIREGSKVPLYLVSPRSWALFQEQVGGTSCHYGCLLRARHPTRPGDTQLHEWQSLLQSCQPWGRQAVQLSMS